MRFKSSIQKRKGSCKSVYKVRYNLNAFIPIIYYIYIWVLNDLQINTFTTIQRVSMETRHLTILFYGDALYKDQNLNLIFEIIFIKEYMKHLT